MKKLSVIFIFFGYYSWSQLPTVPVAVLYKWNEIGMQAAGNIGPEHFSPMQESRMHAMASAAMYNIVNILNPKYQLFRGENMALDFSGVIQVEAAIATAAYTIFIHEMPAQQVFLDSLYHNEIESINALDAKSNGIALGARMAKSLLEWRANDKSGEAMYPGDYLSLQ